MTLMLAATSICATDGLERHLAPPGFQCCERDLLGRSKLQDSAMRRFHQKKVFLHRCKDFCTLDALGKYEAIFGMSRKKIGIAAIRRWGTAALIAGLSSPPHVQTIVA